MFFLRGHSELREEWAELLGVSVLEILGGAGDLSVTEELGDRENVLRELVERDGDCPAEVVWSELGIDLGFAFEAVPGVSYGVVARAVSS